jgi:hypothetical protein
MPSRAPVADEVAVRKADRAFGGRGAAAEKPRAREGRPSRLARERAPASHAFAVPNVSELPARASEDTADDTW